MPTYNDVMSGGIWANGSSTCQVKYAPGNYSPVAVPFDARPSGKANLSSRINVLDKQNNGLAHWWNFKQAGGKLVYDFAQGADATLISAAPANNWVTDGTRNGVVYQNQGTDYIEAEVNEVTQIDGAQQMTISAWVYMTSLSSQIVIASKNDSAQDGFILGWDNTEGFAFRIPSGGGQQAWTGLAGYSANIWYHLTVVFNGGLAGNANRVKIYVNGVKQTLNFFGTIGSSIVANSIKFRIGAASISATPSYHWLGKLDDIRHYNRALSDAEVGNLAQRNSVSRLAAPMMVVATTYVLHSQGVLAGGLSAQTNIESPIVGAGPPLLAGSAQIQAIYLKQTTGVGVLCNGQAPVQNAYIPQGGAYGDGSATTSLGFSTFGGLYGSGTSVPFGTVNEPPFGQAAHGAIIGGVAHSDQSRIYGYVTTGDLVVVDGAASAGITGVAFDADGGINISNEDTVVNFSFTKLTNFYWNIRAKIEKNYTFYWNVGLLKIFWYRIVSKGLNANGCPVKGVDCCQKFIVNVHARTISELCDKLKKRRYKFPIQSVERFSKPAENSEVKAQEAAGVDETCQTLIPVQVCSVPECADFCVDFDLVQNIGFGTKLQFNSFFSYDTQGSAFINGSAGASYTRNVPHLSHVAEGGVSLGSNSICQCNHYVGRGGALAGGAAASQSSRWRFIGGVWPIIRPIRFGNSNDSVLVDSGDALWALPERVNKQDSLFSQSDISFGKNTQSLFTYGFGTDLPSWANIIGIQVRIGRLATQVGVRDLAVYLVCNGERISDNLAVTNVDWPLLETERIYGSNGLDGKINWRDPNDDHYIGPVTVSDLNNPTFGLEIRAKAGLSIATTLAKINYINLQVYYEDASGSIIRMGGESHAKGVKYHYSSTGKVVVDSLSNYRQGFRFISTGRSYAGFAGVTIDGHASVNFLDTMSGGAIAGGEAKITPYIETMSGGAMSGGEAKVVPYFDTMSGGAMSGGEARVQSHLHYTTTGGPALSSLTFTPFADYKYTTTGNVLLDGNIAIKSSSWKMISDGNIVLVSGSADLRPGNIELPPISIGYGMSILQISATFLNDVDLQDAVILSSTMNQCDCSGVPLLIDFTNNIARDNLFYNFLIRNNQAIPKTVQLKYNTINNSWQNNLHYRGISAESGLPDSWDLTFELQCTNSSGGITIGASIWKLSVQIVRKNLITKEMFETKIIVGVLPDNICATNGLNFNIAYNTQLDSATIRPNSTIYQNTIYDNIGLFKNPSWITTPNLNLKISQSGALRPTTRVDLTDAVLVQ